MLLDLLPLFQSRPDSTGGVGYGPLAQAAGETTNWLAADEEEALVAIAVLADIAL